MRRKKLSMKVSAAVLAAATFMSTCPTAAFAVTGDKKAADGTYTATKHVSKTEADVDDEWNEYDVEVSVTVKDGKFSDITVTPKNGYVEADNSKYFNKAYTKTSGIKTLLVGQDATEDNINGWSTVSGATRTSTAIKEAALEAIKGADEALDGTVVSDTSVLEAQISAADKVNAATESVWTGDWSTFTSAYNTAKNVLAAYNSDKKAGTTQEAVDAAAKNLTTALNALVRYAYMNIPYADFYAGEGVTTVDVVTSATKNKTKNANISGGSYHTEDGSEITGVTYPVQMTAATWASVDWSAYKEVTDNDKLEITTNNHGNVSTTTYTGKDTLCQAASNAYYMISKSEAPESYKVLNVENGTFSFSKVQGNVSTVTDENAEIDALTPWGDYCLSLSDEVGSQLKLAGVDDRATVYGAIVTDTDGNKYAMRHLENIWNVKGTAEIAWSVGYVTEEPHGNTLSADAYKNLNGATIKSVTYYTSNGNYTVNVGKNGLYVPVKADYCTQLKVENPETDAAETTISGTDSLPSDFAAEYSSDTLENIKVANNILTFDPTDAAGTQYIVVSDKNGKYASVELEISLTSSKVVAAFDESSDSLVAAEDVAESVFASYLYNMESVTVNDTVYEGWRNVGEVINDDGTINETGKAFKDAKAGDKFTITVKSEGYTNDLTFTYTVPEYTYAYAAVSYSEYYANEDVQNAGSSESSDVKDTNGEYDKGAFDTVTRATANHGLHRGSFQQDVVIYDTDGNSYEPVSWTDANTAVLKDGSTLVKATDRTTGVTTLTVDGKTTTYKDYEVKGIKYVPVKVKTKNFEAFKEAYSVVENGETLSGGYSEKNLNSYTAVAAVDADTNGLKTVTMSADGTFSFGAAQEGTTSGLKDTELKVADTSNMGVEVVSSSSFGDFLRVDLTENYGDLGAALQSVEWTYYGEGDTALATYGTKFAADNWMHKSMGIQLGLTDSLRCQLPEGTDGSGKWVLTIHALGYADTKVEVTVAESDVHKPTEVNDITKLEAAIESAEALNEADYTAQSWENMQAELEEAKYVLEDAKNSATSQESVDEATNHLNDAIASLEKVNKFTGLSNTPAEDGNYYYYVDGEIDYDINTIVNNANGWWKVTDGKVDFAYNGISNNEYGWWYVEDGKVTFDYDGIENTKTDWWKITDSAVDFDYTGVTNNENGWWYVKDGKVDFSYNGIKNNQNGWWKITNGKVDFSYTGVTNNENGWWYVEDGKVDFSYNGIKNNQNGWWKITNGKVDFNYTGVANNENGWWRVENGKVNFNFNGIANNENGWWYIKGGKVDFSYNGTVKLNGKSYKVVNGKVRV